MDRPGVGRGAALLLLLLALQGPARAQEPDRETFELLGWNKACSVAVAHFGYPALGVAISDRPVLVRIGALSIPTGARDPVREWLIETKGYNALLADEAAVALERLEKVGYTRKGFSETVRTEPVGPQPGLEALLRSTAALEATAVKGWPGAGWTLSAVHYSPLSSCALVVYRRQGESKDFFYYTLTRLRAPRGRIARARGHVSNARLLLDAGEAPGALAEAAIAAKAAPEYGLARFHHAALLCHSGSTYEALDELETAIRLDPKFKAEARRSIDFESLYKDKRFRALTQEPKK